MRVPALLLLSLCVGCGGAQEPPPETAAQPALEGIASEPGLAALPAGHLWRVQVMRVMSPGMGAFLQRIEVRERLTEGGKFVGFEIVRLKGDRQFWQGVDLRAGDVVLHVNGQPLGHYKDAYRVWKSLATAPSLVVSYERAGQVRELRYTIHDEGGEGGVVSPIASGWPGATTSPSDAGTRD